VTHKRFPTKVGYAKKLNESSFKKVLKAHFKKAVKAH
jgi:hypothetical protein